MKGFARFVAVLVVVFGLTGGTALAAPAKFYDEANSSGTCVTGPSPIGASYGTARWTLNGSTGTVHIHAHGLGSPGTYIVRFWPSFCVPQVLGTLTTNARGNGSGSYTFTPTATGWFELAPNSGTAYGTPLITF